MTSRKKKKLSIHVKRNSLCQWTQSFVVCAGGSFYMRCSHPRARWPITQCTSVGLSQHMLELLLHLLFIWQSVCSNNDLLLTMISFTRNQEWSFRALAALIQLLSFELKQPDKSLWSFQAEVWRLIGRNCFTDIKQLTIALIIFISWRSNCSCESHSHLIIIKW